jgi:hypothetical protein
VRHQRCSARTAARCGGAVGSDCVLFTVTVPQPFSAHSVAGFPRLKKLWSFSASTYVKCDGKGCQPLWPRIHIARA